jgi:hypothetical protein
MFINNVDDFYCQIWCLWTLMYDVYVVCGFSCDDIVYVVINILYVSI